jgi:glycosyltransferase involved in cell wall biosynthesis
LSAARGLEHAGLETVVTTLKSSPIETRFLQHKFDVKSVESFGPARFWQLSRIAKNFFPDVIFTYGGPETTAALFLKQHSKLIRFYGQKIDSSTLGNRIFGRLSRLHIDKFIVPSRFVGSALEKMIRGSVHTIPLGCDSRVFSYVETPRSNRPEILIFGRLDPIKGHREFLPIFKELVQMARTFGDPIPRLKIVGMPANLSSEHIRMEARRLNLSDSDVVIQCERVENVAEMMARCSLGLVSSIGSEVICRVAHEFLLCGTPVVTTNVGSLPEVFIDKNFGAYYEPANPLDAASRIYQWLRAAHCEANAQRQIRSKAARSLFSIERMADDIRRVIFS